MNQFSRGIYMSKRYLENTFENLMISREIRQMIEKEVLKCLTPNQIKVIELRFGFVSEPLDRSQIAYSLNMEYWEVEAAEKAALYMIREIILENENEMIDSTIGMTSAHLYKISSCIVEILQLHPEVGDPKKNRSQLMRWVNSFIIWNLTSEERKILLWSCNALPYSDQKGQEYYVALTEVIAKIKSALKLDTTNDKKCYFKVRV